MVTVSFFAKGGRIRSPPSYATECLVSMVTTATLENGQIRQRNVLVVNKGPNPTTKKNQFATRTYINKKISNIVSLQ